MTEQAFESLERRSFASYLSRVKASERLARLNTAWNFSLMASSVVTTVDSIVLLVDPKALGRNGAVTLTCASVLTLFISTSISGMNLSGRSRDMFTSYRRIQRLCSEVERAKHLGAPAPELERLARDYDELLDNSDNHRTCDFYRAFPDRRPRWWSARDEWAHLLAPMLLLLMAIVLVAPAMAWMIDG